MNKTVLIAAHGALLRAGIAELLSGRPGVKKVLDAGSLDDALLVMSREPVDVVLLDPHVGQDEENPAKTIGRLRQNAPGVRIVVMGRRPLRGLALCARRAGADAWVDLEAGVAEFANIVNGRMNGWERSKGIEDPAARLSRREHEVLCLIANGATTKEMAEQLGISHKTIEKHRGRLGEKLSLRNIAELTRFAVENGLV